MNMSHMRSSLYTHANANAKANAKVLASEVGPSLFPFLPNRNPIKACSSEEDQAEGPQEVSSSWMKINKESRACWFQSPGRSCVIERILRAWSRQYAGGWRAFPC